MNLRDDEVMGIRVETVSGRRIGTLVGLVWDGESGFIVQYRVRPKGMLAACLPGMRELLIAHVQVVGIDAKRMVVQDDGAAAGGEGRRKHAAPSMSPQPLSTEARSQ